MEEIVEKAVKAGPIIKPFTEESLKKIKNKIELEKKGKDTDKSKTNIIKKNVKNNNNNNNNRLKERPNPALLPGKKFPEKLGEFPRELYGKPIEDLDEFYKNKYTFMVVSKDGTMFRFSSTKAFFLMSPFTKIRTIAVYILTHPFFSLMIMTVILVNCIFMAMNKDVAIAEYTFTTIFTAESLNRMIARGFILHEFTYLRDPWNWLDFVVVVSAYLQILLQGRLFLGLLRTFRVFRALKTVAVVPGLKLIVGALMEAVKRLRDVTFLTIFMLSIFALIGLQLYHGKLLRKCVKNPNPSWAAYISQHKLWEFGNNSDNWLKHSSGTYEVCEPDGSGKICPSDYSCLEVGDNPNFGYTNFDTFYFAFLCAFRLMTQDYWESLYQLVLKANGSTHMIFFIFVVFLGSFYLINLILAIVAMSYDDCRKKEEKEAEEELAAALEEEQRQIELIEEAMQKSPRVSRRNSETASYKENVQPRQGTSDSNRSPLNEVAIGSSPPHSPSQDKAKQLYYMLNRSRAPRNMLMTGTPISKMLKVSSSNKLVTSFMDSLSRNTSPLPSPPTFKFDVTGNSARHDSQVSDKSFELPEVQITLEQDDDDDEDDNVEEKCEYDRADISSKHLMSSNLIRRVSKVSSIMDMKDAEALKEFLESYTQGRLSFKENKLSCSEVIVSHIENILFGWEYPTWWKTICHPIEQFIMDPFVDLFITLCIVVNTALMALDHADISDNMAYVLRTGNFVFTGIFASEAFLKILSLGMLNYSKNRWNLFDLAIVILSLLELVLQRIKSFSILRSFRLLRIFKLAKSWPTLNLLIGIIGRTLGALGNLCLVLAIIIFIFAVMGVQIFGKDYEKARDSSETAFRWNFVDFPHSFMIVFRVLCGEWIESMWDCMIWSSSYICIPFFLLTMIIGNLVVLNLFLALLLSSFGTECLNKEEKSEITKLQEAADRMHRFFLFSSSKCSIIFRCFCIRKKNDKRAVANLKVQNRECLSPAYSTVTRMASSVTDNSILYDNFQKSQQSLRFASSSSLAELSDSEDSSNELTSIYGSRIEEVTVVHVNFPNDCCPRRSRCKGILSSLMNTKCGHRWWSFRCYCKILVESKLFEMFTIFIIIVSSLTLAMEDKNINSKPALKSILNNLDKVFTVAFTMELILKMTGRGLVEYFKDPWCWLDFIIVAVSLVGEAAEKANLSHMVAFRALRTLRALRPLKAVSRWEGMKVVVNALFQAIPAIFNVLLVCLVFWLIFSIIGVTLFAGKFNFCTNDFGATLLNSSIIANKSQCENMNLTWFKPKVNFDNVAAGYLALFQVATFKGWTDIMKYATDITEKDEQPEKENVPSMYLYFVTFIIFGSFFTLNLFIGVIIDNFNVQKRKAGGSLDMFLTEDQKRYYNAMKKLGSKQPQKPIPKPSIKFQLFFFKLVSNQAFDVAIMCVIVINMICMAVEYHNQPKELEDTLDYVNQLFVAIFTMECVFKLMAYRLYYFKQPWNTFDFVVVIISILGLALMTFVKKHLVSPTLIRVVRVFRVGRILRLVKSAKGIRTLLFSLAVSLPALFNIGLLLFLIMFIYAIFGVSFFMNVKYSNGIDDIFNFETVLNSILILFQIATSAGWHGVLEALRTDDPDCDSNSGPDSYCGRGPMAVAFLVTYLIISFLVIINMYIAVILENFSQATEDVQRGLTQDDIDMYYETWEKFDENATGYMGLEKLSEFLDALEPPLGIPSPNYFSIIHLDIPICENDLVHCVDILDALAKRYLGTSKDEARELGDVKKGSGKKNYLASTSTMQRQREIFCAKLIQIVWRKHVEKKKRERMQMGSAMGTTQAVIERRDALNMESNSNSPRKDSEIITETPSFKSNLKNSNSLFIINPTFQTKQSFSSSNIAS